MAHFLYVSYVSEDLERSVDALATLGLVEVWRGSHAYFGADAVLCAAQQGGVLAVAGPLPRLSPVLAGSRQRRDSMLHIAVCDLPGDWREGLPVSVGVETYAGPLGPSTMLAFDVGDEGGQVLIEIVSGQAHVGSANARSLRVENTPYVGSSLAELRAIFAAIGLTPIPNLDAVVFPTLQCRTEAIILDGWHFIELNAPTGDGPMHDVLTSLGKPGLFGLNLEPEEFHESETPVDLPVVVNGHSMVSHRIVFVPPRFTGGALIFKVRPVSFPWQFLCGVTGEHESHDSTAALRPDGPELRPR